MYIKIFRKNFNCSKEGKIVVTLKLLNQACRDERDTNKNISVSRLRRVINQKSVLIAVSTLDREKKFTYAPPLIIPSLSHKSYLSETRRCYGTRYSRLHFFEFRVKRFSCPRYRIIVLLPTSFLKTTLNKEIETIGLQNYPITRCRRMCRARKNSFISSNLDVEKRFLWRNSIFSKYRTRRVHKRAMNNIFGQF